MPFRGTFPCDSEQSAVRIVVLHDDHLTATRGTLVASGIAEEMGLGEDCGTQLWNVDLLDTPFARAVAIDTANADVLIVALRGIAGFSTDLKFWLRRWLLQTKDRSTVLIAVFENHDELAARDARAFIERAARSAGKEFFSEPADDSPSSGLAEPHEFLWVL